MVNSLRIRYQRCFLLVFILFCLFIFFFNNKQSPSIDREQTDEIINLVDLFQHSFQLVYQSGKLIQKVQQNQIKFNEIIQKKSLANLPNEPLTIADLLSHSNLKTGLKHKFPHIQIISEEKDSIDKNQLNSFKDRFEIDDQLISSPSIHDQKQFLTVPLSSVAVWIDPLDATKEFTEGLLEYVTVMLCVTIDNQPTIGIVYAPFTNQFTWGWVGVDQSKIVDEENVLKERHKEEIDEIIVSRSHAGQVHEILQKIYKDKQYKIIPAAGSAYKTIQVLHKYADYYLHITPIKKWDVCAPDAILRANHGTMSTLHNRTIDYNRQQLLIRDGILATYQVNHQQILNFLIDRNLTAHLSTKHS